jgi:hypothetical protein
MNKKNWEETKANWAKASLLKRLVFVLFFGLGTPFVIYVYFVASDSPFQKIYTSFSSENNNSELSTQSNNYLDITLNNTERTGSAFCTNYFDIKNNSNFNITTAHLYVVLRGSDGIILKKELLGINQSKPMSNVVSHIISHMDCSAISSIEVESFSLLEIDGDSVMRSDMPEIIFRTNSLVGIALKSSGGEIPNQQIDTSNNSSTENEVTPNNSVINTESCMQQCGNPNTSCVSLSMSAEQDCRLAIQACQLKCIQQ